MPLFEFRCNACGAVSEVLVLRGDAAGPRCSACGSPDLARLVSRFSFKAARRAKYSEDFREKQLPFLKSRPGMGEAFAEGSESEEAKAYKLSEQIGVRVDAALESQVFRKL
jgi:putative FmdB family regulatory protein